MYNFLSIKTMPIPIDDNILCSLEETVIDNFIKEIQESSKQENKSKIKKPKHMNERYVPYAKQDYHALEEKVRQLEINKTDLERKASTLRRRNNINELNKINKKIIHIREQIEKTVYMRSCVYKEIRNVPGYDKFANKKCEFFFTNIGCLNGNTCPYRH